MPFSRSRSPESMARSSTCWCSPKAPPCHSIASTSVVLPWSTCATMATFRRSERFFVSDMQVPRLSVRVSAPYVDGCQPVRSRKQPGRVTVQRWSPQSIGGGGPAPNRRSLGCDDRHHPRPRRPARRRLPCGRLHRRRGVHRVRDPGLPVADRRLDPLRPDGLHLRPVRRIGGRARQRLGDAPRVLRPGGPAQPGAPRAGPARAGRPGARRGHPEHRRAAPGGRLGPRRGGARHRPRGDVHRSRALGRASRTAAGSPPRWPGRSTPWTPATRTRAARSAAGS